MLTELCQELKNWFYNRDEIQTGTFEIENGALSLPFLQNGQYFRIIGSVFNDGVHCYSDYIPTLANETFTGAIWPMKIPQAVIDLASEISAWKGKYQETINSPYQSQSWQGWSGTLKNGNNGSFNWKDAFRDRLNEWRKI